MNIAEQEFPFPAEHASNVFGQFDANMKKIEKTLHVTIIFRDDKLKLIGGEKDCDRAKHVIEQLLLLSQRGNDITEQNINYTLSLSMTNAGTGKTYLAMAKAITAFKANEVNRIILTRPAIEAGEKLGFLPGDLQSKVDPYLRPLYDALYEIMGADTFAKNMEKGLIEVAPLAYMRGRTLDNAFHVLKNIDEIGVCNLTSKDVVRHPLVQKIVTAYDEYDKKKETRQKRKQRTTGKQEKK